MEEEIKYIWLICNAIRLQNHYYKEYAIHYKEFFFFQFLISLQKL